MSDAEARWWPEAVLDRGRFGGLVEPVLDRIALARDRERFPHALLMVGQSGLGRELAAVEAAVMLTCPGADHPWSVSSCADRIRSGVHPDVVAMLPAGKKGVIKIDPIRDDVVAVVGARPYEGLRRVWIFNAVEAEHLPRPSANAFLKTLEEPPDHAVFILLAANPTAVLPTIRSRCQMLSLPGPASLGADLHEGVPPELSGVALRGADLDAALSETRRAFEIAIGGEVAPLLKLPHVIDDRLDPFELVAAVATEMAAEPETADRGDGLIRLAVELLATERRSRALNLGADRQLIGCLLRWYREDLERET